MLMVEATAYLQVTTLLEAQRLQQEAVPLQQQEQKQQQQQRGSLMWQWHQLLVCVLVPG
jgi:hypothetical protein